MPKNTTNNEKEVKTRNWEFIMYPDSAPANWRDVLTEHKLNIIVGPLHDKDIDPHNQPKKPHWHVIIIFDNTKTFKFAEKISKSVNGALPIPVNSLNGSIRYLTHIDNPEKAQYKKSDIVNIGSYDIETAFTNSVDKYLAIREMIKYIKENQVVEYIDFMEYCAVEHFDDWFRLLCDNSSFVIQGAITSNRHKLRDAMFYKEED